MNLWWSIAAFIVAWCVIYGTIYLFMRAWERRTNAVKPFDGYYQGLLRSLLAEFEKEESL
jgi:hypothetical protein